MTPAQPTDHEFVVRKSRFIGYAACTDSRDARTSLLHQLHQSYPDASHICHASRIGSPQNGQLLCDDDGEPGGTAGRPILNVIQHSVVGDITIAVVRYFGGVRLGAGGLVRAYSATASKVMQNLPLRKSVKVQELEVTCQFAMENPVRKLIDQSGGENLLPRYHEALTLSFALPASAVSDLQEALNDLTRGQAELVVRQE